MKSQQKNQKTIDSFLSNVINESLRSTLQRRALQEKETQDLFGDGGSEDESVSKKGEDEKSKLKKGDISSKDIVEKLNAIRSGKSFKDQAVSSSLEKYIGDMTKAEKTALFAFLKGISQIVTGEIPGDDALEPADDPASIEMEKTSDSKKVTIKPVIVKKVGKEEDKDKEAAPKEDTSGPVPIKPKSSK